MYAARSGNLKQTHGPTRRCSGRASRPEIGAILKRDVVPTVVPIVTARR
jgi:hypothetical protein